MTSKPARKTKLNPHISVDCVILGFDFQELKVLLIERKLPPATKGAAEEDFLALPGNLIQENETLDESAERVLNELTGLNNIYMEQVGAFGDPDRTKRSEKDMRWLRHVRSKPEEHVVTIAYYSLVNLNDYKPAASSFAKVADWHSLKDFPQLAFDHNSIVEKAQLHLKNKLRNEPIGFELLPKKFSLGQLQKLYEAIVGEELDKRNFRRKILKTGLLIALDEKQKGVAHKRANLYSFDKKKYAKLKSEGFDFQYNTILNG